MNMKKVLAMMLAVLMIVTATVAGTVAWLTTSTQEVKNTFSPTDIAITLTETFNADTNGDGTKDAWVNEMVPGAEYDKDPVVAVDDTKTDVDVYLFVKFVEENVDHVTYTSTLTEANGWKLVDGTTNVWWREVKVSDTEKSWNLLDGNKITVKTDVTKDNMTTASMAKLTYQAYAIQKSGFDTATLAWAEVSK